MKKPFARWIVMLSLIVGVFTGVSTAFAAVTPTFSLSLDRTEITNGNEVVVTVKGTGIQEFFGLEPKITYDTAKLKLIKAEANATYFTLRAEVEEENRVTLGLTKSSNQTLTSATKDILKLTFKGNAIGAADITLATVTALDNSILAETVFNVGATQTLTIGSSDSTAPPVTPITPSPPVPPITPSPTAPSLAPPATPGSVLLTPVLNGQTAQSIVEVEAFTDAFDKAPIDAQGNKVVQLDVQPIVGAKAYVVELPLAQLDQVGQGKISIQTQIGTVVIPDHMFKSKDVAGSSTLGISIALGDTSTFSEELKRKIGDKPVITLHALVDGQVVPWKNNQAPVTIVTNYTPTTEELKHPEHIAIWYVDGAGNIQKVPSGKYDAVSGKITFTTTHFSTYTVAYEITTFADIRNLEWARSSIEVMVSKGIVNGTSETTFTPYADITRGDFIKLLIGALGIHSDFKTNFEDIGPTDYYYEEAGIAKELGISTGVDGNRLDPKKPITRQDIMVMVERAMRIAHKELVASKGTELAPFEDHNQVADYATNSLSLLIKNGLIEGDGTLLHPTQHTTRAEAAVFLYRIYNK